MPNHLKRYQSVRPPPSEPPRKARAPASLAVSTVTNNDDDDSSSRNNRHPSTSRGSSSVRGRRTRSAGTETIVDDFETEYGRGSTGRVRGSSRTPATDGGGASATHSNTDETTDDTESLSDKIVLAVCTWGTKIGCCYYNPFERKLHLIEDAVDSSKFDLAMNIINQVQPHLILVSNRADEHLLEAIKLQTTQSVTDFAPIVEHRPNREFVTSQGRGFLLALPLLNSHDTRDVNDDEEGLAEGGGEDGDGAGDEIVNVGTNGLQNAYNFMRLRRKRLLEGHAGLFLRGLKLGSAVSLEASAKTLEAVACLFSYLNRRRAGGGLTDESEILDVVSIELIPLDKTMIITSESLQSLQIFEDDQHGNVHQTGRREGLSLYSLLSNTRSAMGKNLLRRWLMQPSLEIPVIEARLAAVECFVRPANGHIVRQLQKRLTVRNIARTLKALREGFNPVQNWEAIFDFLKVCVAVRDEVGKLIGGEGIQILEKLCESFEVGTFNDLAELIQLKIDFAESKIQHRICIQEGIDERLDENRRMYNGLPSMLSRVATHISHNLSPEFCTSLNVVYFPQLGYLCAVPLPEVFPNEEMEAATPRDWQQQWRTEISIYYKCNEMRELDEYLGDIHGFIVDREVELVSEMLDQIVQAEDVLIHTCEVLAELDVLLAFADAAKTGSWTRPMVIASNVIRIDEARHPLVELVVDNFVPNDCHLVGGRGITQGMLEELANKPDISAFLREERRHAKRDAAARRNASQAPDGADASQVEDSQAIVAEIRDTIMANVREKYGPVETEGEGDNDDESEELLLSPDDSMMILTGANASGKSVYLKATALIVYMAHIGSFVPAERAIIGLTDKIMTRVTTRESFSRSQSAFMIDLQQISFMLRNCTERSLLIVDEFGKGTNTADGAGLFVGLVKLLVTKGERLPKTLLASHFHEIFINNFLPRGLPVGLAHMELIVDKEVQVGSSTGQRRSNGNGGSPASSDEKVVSVTPLFRLAPGLCLKSFAYQCAESYGIPDGVVERAMEVSHALSTFNILSLMDRKMSREEETKLKSDEDTVRRLLQTNWDITPAGTTMKQLAKIVGEEGFDSTFS